MIVKRQKEFGKIAGLKNKIKSIPRHLKRSAEIKSASNRSLNPLVRDLSSEDVKNIAILHRSAQTPGTKAYKKAQKAISEGKLSPEVLAKETEAWEGIHKQGRGARRSLKGWMDPESAAHTDSAFYKLTNPDHPLVKRERETLKAFKVLGKDRI